MATLRTIRKRITSVRNTRQITRAMKLVAAAKLRRAQDSVIAARPFAGKIGEVLGRLNQRVDVEAHPLLERREEKRAEIVVMASDINRYLGEMLDFMKARHSAITQEITEKKALSDELKGKIDAALDEFANIFKTSAED